MLFKIAICFTIPSTVLSSSFGLNKILASVESQYEIDSIGWGSTGLIFLLDLVADDGADGEDGEDGNDGDDEWDAGGMANDEER